PHVDQYMEQGGNMAIHARCRGYCDRKRPKARSCHRPATVMPAGNNPIIRVNQVLLFIVLIFSIICFAKPFRIPIAIGGMMATLLVPICRRLERRKIPRGLSATICVLLPLVLVLAICYLLINQVIALGKDMPTIG